MKVKLYPEERANGWHVIEKWDSGTIVTHGPMDKEKLEAFANELKEVIVDQAIDTKQEFAALVRSDKAKAFFARKD